MIKQGRRLNEPVTGAQRITVASAPSTASRGVPEVGRLSGCAFLFVDEAAEDVYGGEVAALPLTSPPPPSARTVQGPTSRGHGGDDDGYSARHRVEGREQAAAARRSGRRLEACQTEERRNGQHLVGHTARRHLPRRRSVALRRRRERPGGPPAARPLQQPPRSQRPRSVKPLPKASQTGWSPAPSTSGTPRAGKRRSG
jgi:hypothetical protein